ncbi:type VI secretion system ATPase TssH [Paracoccus zhejiangensis]|uniref:Type VI secretion system ATPase TssH n=1 Tax=Paracoccus zhejiangensis TaxID=1077935 RepID=A0A2H5F025_9RHOB|nr:type VI secretion system ATPase TssH [Paracoccus zhejiangensis]AUH64908.1 type VI secretion system ATPase TssH [Paracoccus zhejiangensis]
MTEISIEKFAGKMNRAGYDAFIQAMRHARGEGNRNVELAHWLFHALSNQDCDISVTLRELGLDRGKALQEADRAMAALKKGVTETPGISDTLGDALNHAWTYATLFFGETQIRSGHVLVALLNDGHLRRELLTISPVFGEVSVDRISADSRTLWAGSEEETMRPMDGSGLVGAGTPGAAEGGAKTALGRFSVDMTAQAESGTMDRIVGRDDEIRQIVDILLRRRQNNPILTGEAGVGKTAVVEGFAQRLASGDVPPALQGMRLYMLDIGAMQAGASMKGEFEQRLRSVIEEVQASPIPIILFIDEAHTLIGAGGAQGTGDAANLLKPALARGTLRTIAATTWAEYRNHIEKDPALTRRFQPVTVDEPGIEQCCYMLRGILDPMESHHKVRISDEAITAAVALSARYIPARQLPDKAVSLLDTACARVAISQNATPARIADLREAIAALETEIAAKEAERDLGETNEARLTEAEGEAETLRGKLAEAEAGYAEEKAVVDQILALRERLAEAEGENFDAEAVRAEMAAEMAKLADRNPDDRMIWPHVDEQAVASVISDWTGIPAGRMVADELQAILGLADHLKERVIGQDHGLKMIAKRVETSRAGLSNPNKPIGVFMLAGPSGVGKTETALALAEQLYGGEQNIITINMSEFQEAHSVSLLKGAPPGYVGYGEGGRLTEAVRRKPYSVVLLDEIEKAHPDVHELFFQVFDKGMMEDGNGRPINFRNTLILLTSNVGTNVIMDMAEGGETTPDMETLEARLKPELLKVFPPALLGRIVTIPYFPLGGEVLAGIAKLKLGAIVARMRSAHGAKLGWEDAVIDHIVAECRDPDSGGRMIDNIITNSILPDLSRQVLSRMVEGAAMSDVTIAMKDGKFDYVFA